MVVAASLGASNRNSSIRGRFEVERKGLCIERDSWLFFVQKMGLYTLPFKTMDLMYPMGGGRTREDHAFVQRRRLLSMIQNPTKHGFSSIAWKMGEDFDLKTVAKCALNWSFSVKSFKSDIG